MAVELNHTIVNVRNKEESAAFVAEILGLPPAKPFLGYFLVLRTANGVGTTAGAACTALRSFSRNHHPTLFP